MKISHTGYLMTTVSFFSEQRVWNIMTTWASCVWSFTSERGKTYDPILIMTGTVECTVLVQEIFQLFYTWVYNGKNVPGTYLIRSRWITRCCGSRSLSGSGRIGVILPDPDLYPFQPNVKIGKLSFFQKMSICFPKYWKFGSFYIDEKDKTMETGIAVNNSIKNLVYNWR